MIAAVFFTMALASPAAAGPSVQQPTDRWELGSLWLEQSSTLTWPGLRVPAFTLVPDRRRMHRLSLGLDLPALRGVTFDVITVEPSEDPEIRRLTARMPTGEGIGPYAWTGVRVQIPNSRWQIELGRSTVVRVASAVARSALGRGRGAGWQVNLVRPLR